jgi:pimeloyl-ACP methyl ester carboxylesterase
MPTQLPIKNECAGRKTDGFCTPQEDKVVQKMMVPPRRVIPVVFIPGIMGSNLRMSPGQQGRLGKTNNSAWRPDSYSELAKIATASAAERQIQLDPRQTVVDTYDDGRGPTGNSAESPTGRHAIGDIHVYLSHNRGTPLLTDDPPTVKPRRLKADKARQRGWSEVFLSSYQGLLENCEKYLNSSVISRRWREIIDHDPAEWSAVPDYKLSALTEDEYKAAMKDCFFPVHAMGYNWLEGNELSALNLSRRIAALIQYYKRAEFECEKVILLTHSMGGLVARAIVHPAIGGLSSSVLGIVHGVMPAMGAPAAYKRMRCGFEQDSPGAFVASFALGSTGAKVTAVLGNSLGGLQLLPSQAYGNAWLEIRRSKTLFDTFPKHGDPYEEIYKIKDRWYGLLREEWLNPALDNHGGLAKTHLLLDLAKKFHAQISRSYHPLTYAHYGADGSRPSWERVTWNLSKGFANTNWQHLQIESDTGQGTLGLCPARDSNTRRPERGLAVLGPAFGPGDQTVPLRSSDDQLFCGKLSGVFRQTGYEHQSSYGNEKVLNATLYSIVRIAQKMVWSK